MRRPEGGVRSACCLSHTDWRLPARWSQDTDYSLGVSGAQVSWKADLTAVRASRFRRHRLTEAISALLHGISVRRRVPSTIGDAALVGSADQRAIRAGQASRSRDSGDGTERRHAQTCRKSRASG